MIVLPRRLTLSQLISLALALIFTLLLLFGIKHFYVWPQITQLELFTPAQLFHMHDPHALRYLLMWPIVVLSRAGGCDASVIFSWMVLAELCLIGWVLAKTLPFLAPRPSPWSLPLLLAMWLGLGLLMNGRLAMAFLGTAIILYAQVRFMAEQKMKYRLLALQLFGLLLCSVSSGIFTVAFASIMGFLLTLPLMQWPEKKLLHADLMLLAIAVILLALPIMEDNIFANILFFDNSIANMLFHGPPVVLYEHKVNPVVIESLCFSFMAIAFLITLRCYFFCLWSARHAFAPLILLAGLAAVIGVFGFSTLLSMLPSVTLAIACAARPARAWRESPLSPPR